MKNEKSGDILKNLLIDHTALLVCKNSIERAFEIMKECYIDHGKILVCGNGGSAADAEHIVGELMKGFVKKRKLGNDDIEKIKKVDIDNWKYLSDNLQGALPAISLVSQVSISTAFTNDVAPDMVFAQQVYGYGVKGDVLIGLSTSGNSKNVIYAVKIAKALGMKTIGFLGRNGGSMKDICDAAILVPQDETYKIQEYHLPIYHALCAMIEEYFFEE